jgi:hypothetical protein
MISGADHSGDYLAGNFPQIQPRKGAYSGRRQVRRPRAATMRWRQADEDCLAAVHPVVFMASNSKEQ